ncbi:MAG: cytochrome c3 family protein [Pseudomonadota bacterium]
MNRKMMMLLVLALTGLIFLAVGALTAADVPEKVVLNPQDMGYKEVKKGPVQFSHKKHEVDYKVACGECHHNYKDGKNVWKEGDPVKKCKDCHDPNEKKGNVLELKNALHKNCKDCHKALTEAGKPTGPFKKCNDCHEKKG